MNLFLYFSGRRVSVPFLWYALTMSFMVYRFTGMWLFMYVWTSSTEKLLDLSFNIPIVSTTIDFTRVDCSRLVSGVYWEYSDEIVE